jgi:hypothetical protein
MGGGETVFEANQAASMVIYNKTNHMPPRGISLFLVFIFMALLLFLCILKTLVIDLKLQE